jgi:hypothetical protein
MTCYVNIALGNFFGHVFLFFEGRHGSLLLAFYRLKSIKRKTKAMCRKCTGTKSMTEKITEGHGSGAATKNAGANRRFLGAAWD